MLIRDFERGRSVLARLDHDSEIIASIVAIVDELGIEVGTFDVIGALKRTEIGYYDQDSHKYVITEINLPVELVSCMGNVSIRDGQPFVHAHAALADSEGNLMGGHLQSGIIFAAELFLTELKGETLVRDHDPITDLYLWDGTGN